MAQGSRSIWIPILLSCVFQASDNKHVRLQSGQAGNPEMEHIISQIPSSQTCTGVTEQLDHLNAQLQETTLHNSQLENEAFGSRREIRQLKLQLSTCSLTASAITGSYQAQLLDKVKELLKTFDNDTFLILNIITLSREVNTLQEKIKHAANVSEITDISELQRKQQQKISDLNRKTQQMETSHTNSALILQIISLQNQIWDMERAESRRGEANLQSDSRILALQSQLNLKISELRSKGDTASAMLELIFVHSNIAALQRLINKHIEESRVKAEDYKRQWRQRVELLKRKILQLTHEEHNKKLTKEILMLQAEVEHFEELMKNAKKIADSPLRELKAILEAERKRHDNLQKHLEEVDYAQAQLIMKIISLMKEVRELDDDLQQQTSTSQATSLQTLLQAKDREFAKAQEEIDELQRKLLVKNKECSGLEERYEEVKTEFEQKIAELNRTGDSKAALILNVTNLRNDVNALMDQISNTQDPDRIAELQRQLEEKQDDMNSRTDDIKSLISNPEITLTIMALQNEIWDIQKKATNFTTSSRLQDLQNRVDGLMSDLDDKGDDDTKLMLKLIMLQSQVWQLQRQLSHQMVQTFQVTQLTKDLATKKEELQKTINELNKKSHTNTRLILEAADLHNQLRNLEKEKHNEGQTASATITELREQLKETVEEHARDQAEIKALQSKLNQTEAQCSSFEHKLQDLQNDLDAKMKDLQSRSESVTSLALQISTLSLQLEELKRQLQNTESETKRKELNKIIGEKTIELANKTEALKTRSAQPQRILQIITKQTEIEKLVNVATNDTDYNKITLLQDHLNYLVDGIQDENNEYTKLMFKILVQRDEIARLEKQEKSQTQAALARIKDLENELEDIRNQIKEKTMVLDSSDMRIANLSAQIMELHQKIEPLEEEISDLRDANTENIQDLQKRLDLTKRQLQDGELRLKDADAKNFNLLMEIADLRTQLKKAQKTASRISKKNINELEQQLETQQRENRRLESTNKGLKQEVMDLKKCCTDVNIQCEDLQRQLQQSQEDADRLQQQLHEKDAMIKQLQQDLEEESSKNNTLLQEYLNVKTQLQQSMSSVDNLQQQLQEKDDMLQRLLQKLEEETRENLKLLQDFNNLLSEKNKLEDDIRDLENKLSDVEDKTINTRKVILDPNTAHPRVVLSADNTEMSTSADSQDVPEHPGRYNVILAALGTVGFSAGRHYWEVSVAGKICYHLGMASESAPRQGKIIFSPTNGFWTLVLNKQGQYKAIDKRDVIIPLPLQPATLGILLDYKKGQISFYDAGTRSHLYSFVGQTFTDNIYPFIDFCVEDSGVHAPIVLLSPGSVDWIK